MLYMLGSVQFEVAPVNLDTVTRERGGDFAWKDVIGAQRPAEFTGPADSPVTLSGKLVPHKFGMGAFESLAAMAEAGQPQMLLRGDGTVLGWHVIEKVREKHTYLDAAGVGRWIEFDISLRASPTAASAGSMVSLLFGLF